jgi:membrane dipeptidase
MAQTSTTYPPVFDGHNDTILSMVRTGRSFFERADGEHIDLPRAKEGGLGGGFFAVYIPDPVVVERMMSKDDADVEDTLNIYGDESTWPEPMSLEYAQNSALTLLGKLLKVEQQSNGEVKIVRTAAELQTCLDNGTFAMLLHFEGAEPLDEAGDALEVFYAAGLRSVGLTHFRQNIYCAGVPNIFPSSPDIGEGLTDAGKELVRQLNRRKVLVDLSHANEKTFWEVANITDAPLVATHSNAWEMSNSPRNLTDKQLAAIRESNGMVGLNYHCGFLRKDGEMNPDTPISTMVDQIEYLIDKLGIDCVGLGSDFDGSMVPNPLKDAAGLPKLMSAIEERGYDRAALTKIAHGNWVRVLGATWGA